MAIATRSTVLIAIASLLLLLFTVVTSRFPSSGSISHVPTRIPGTSVQQLPGLQAWSQQPRFAEYYQQEYDIHPQWFLTPGVPSALQSWRFLDALGLLRVVKNSAPSNTTSIAAAASSPPWTVVDIGGAWQQEGGTDGIPSDHMMAALHSFSVPKRFLYMDAKPNARKDFQSRTDTYIQTIITPANAAGLLRGANVPHDFDLLKIDVDGPDCALASAVLASYRPKAFIVEVTNMFPPPIEWHVGYETWRDMLDNHPEPLWGCSLSYATNHVAKPHGYTLVQYVMEDAFFVRDDLFVARNLYESSHVSSLSAPPGPQHGQERHSAPAPCEAFAEGNPWLFTQGQFAAGPAVIKEWARWGASGADRAGLFAKVMGNVSKAMAEPTTRWSRFRHWVSGKQPPLKMKFSPFYVSIDHHDRSCTRRRM